VVNIQKAIENGHLSLIVDVPIENCDVPLVMLVY
jgi:hypothetical protein